LIASLAFVWSLLVAFVSRFVYGTGVAAAAAAAANMVSPGLLSLVHARSLVYIQ